MYVNVLYLWSVGMTITYNKKIHFHTITSHLDFTCLEDAMEHVLPANRTRKQQLCKQRMSLLTSKSRRSTIIWSLTLTAAFRYNKHWLIKMYNNIKYKF